jgi:hypothetical protein
MHLSSLLLTASAGASAVSGSILRTRSPYVVKERHNVPNRWRDIGPPSPEHLIHLQIGLTQSNFDELERHLYEGTFSSSVFTRSLVILLTQSLLLITILVRSNSCSILCDHSDPCFRSLSCSYTLCCSCTDHFTQSLIQITLVIDNIFQRLRSTSS